MSDVELKILRESNSVTKNRLDQNHEDLVSLKQRFERILDTNGSELPTNFMDTPKNSVPNSSNASQSDTTTNQTSSMVTITPTPSEASLITNGQLEIYSSSGKTVPVYQDATTISSIKEYLPDKSIVTFYKKSTNWYYIQIPDTENYGWVSEQNTRK